MRAFASFRSVRTGDVMELMAGEIIGRSDLAGICVEDPRVSEAHAMLSLRGRSLMLLGLRGRFRVGGSVVSECEVRAGVTIELAPRLEFECLACTVPDDLPGLEAPGLPPMLLGGTVSVHIDDGEVRVTRGYQASADAVVWPLGRAWRVSVPGEDVRPVAIGDVVAVKGVTLTIVGLPTPENAMTRTREGLRMPMVFEAAGDVVRVLRDEEAVEVIGGIPGRILAAVIRAGGTLPWREVTEEVWPLDRSLESALRKRFDVGLSRLRERLSRLLDLDEELIALDGSGIVVLKLRERDQLSVVEA